MRKEPALRLCLFTISDGGVVFRSFDGLSGVQGPFIMATFKQAFREICNCLATEKKWYMMVRIRIDCYVHEQKENGTTLGYKIYAVLLLPRPGPHRDSQTQKSERTPPPTQRNDHKKISPVSETEPAVIEKKKKRAKVSVLAFTMPLMS